jgi:hypothetical protein
VRWKGGFARRPLGDSVSRRIPWGLPMVIVRAAVHFIYQIVVALILTLLVASLWALARGGGFLHTFHVSLYVFGGLALLLGAVSVGGMSPSAGFIGGAGRIPGLKAATYVPPDSTAVNANEILLLTGAALIGIATAV